MLNNYRLPRDLAGFEPVTFRVKNHCVGLRPAPPLAEARVTPASYRFAFLFSNYEPASIMELSLDNQLHHLTTGAGFLSPTV